MCALEKFQIDGFSHHRNTWWWVSLKFRFSIRSGDHPTNPAENAPACQEWQQNGDKGVQTGSVCHLGYILALFAAASVICNATGTLGYVVLILSTEKVDHNGKALGTLSEVMHVASHDEGCPYYGQDYTCEDRYSHT